MQMIVACEIIPVDVKESKTTLRVGKILIRFTHCYFCHELSLKVSGRKPGYKLRTVCFDHSIFTSFKRTQINQILGTHSFINIRILIN